MRRGWWFLVRNVELSMKSSSKPCSSMVPHRSSEDGYILITLILFVALLAISMAILAPVISQQIKRDREEELIHRGVQYSRAIKHYVKKFGRYPTRIEDLENTNNLRYLRRRYKDPVTHTDFKILRMGDVQMSFGSGIAGAVPVNGLAPANGAVPGVNSPGGPGGGLNSPGGFGSGGFAGGGGMNSPGGPGAAVGAPTASPSGAGGGTPGNAGGAGAGQESDEGDSATPGAGANPSAQNPNAAAGPAVPGQQNAFGTVQTNGQVFGGGPMVGVVSTSKDKTIRVFSKKEHYNEWQFIYNPATDTGGLLATPNVPSLQGASGPQAFPGKPAGNGAPGQAQPPGAQPPPTGQPQQGMQPPAMPPEDEN